MTMLHWNTIDTAPAEEMVWTKIDDEHGPRNHQQMIRRGRLWFTSAEPGAMYAYYTPTHWSRVAVGEQEPQEEKR